MYKKLVITILLILTNTVVLEAPIYRRLPHLINVDIVGSAIVSSHFVLKL